MKNDTPTQHTRKLTLCKKAFPRKTSDRYRWFPAIMLSGKWLQDHGFKIGHVIDIACSQGQLIITISNEQRFQNI